MTTTDDIRDKELSEAIDAAARDLHARGRMWELFCSLVDPSTQPRGWEWDYIVREARHWEREYNSDRIPWRAVELEMLAAISDGWPDWVFAATNGDDGGSAVVRDLAADVMRRYNDLVRSATH